MMRFIPWLLVLSIAPIVAQGATVAFDPPILEIHVAGGVTTGTFQITVASTEVLATFNSVDMVIGSNDVQLTAFVLTDEFIDATTPFNAVEVPGPGTYSSDVFVGGFSFINPWTPPTSVGTLFVNAAGLSAGDYAVSVDFKFDGRSIVALGLPTEGLTGVATVRVITDCNANGQLDSCDVSCGEAGDPCFGVPECGTAADCNLNGIPDECEPPGAIMRFRVRCVGGQLQALAETFLPPGTLLTFTNTNDAPMIVPVNNGGKAQAIWLDQVGTPQVCLAECPTICRNANCQ